MIKDTYTVKRMLTLGKDHVYIIYRLTHLKINGNFQYYIKK